MSRKRMITPSIWEDPGFNKLSITARLAFIGMISNADDEGYLRADLRSLKRLVFGFDENLGEKWYEELKEIKNIHLFEVDGEAYAHFIKWDEHQKQQKDRISPSTFPKCSWCSNPTITEVLKDIDGGLTLPFKVRIAKRDGICRYCGLKFPTKPFKFIIEHIIPKKQGGETNEENCVLACQSCNTKKGSRTPEEAKMKLLDPVSIQNVSNLDTEVSKLSKEFKQVSSREELRKNINQVIKNKSMK